MVLRIEPGGEEVLARWLNNQSPSEADRALVVEVIRAIAGEQSLRWYRVSDTSDDTITIIEPREGLTVHVRLQAGDPASFELVRILYMTTVDPIHPDDGIDDSGQIAR